MLIRLSRAKFDHISWLLVVGAVVVCSLAILVSILLVYTEGVWSNNWLFLLAGLIIMAFVILSMPAPRAALLSSLGIILLVEEFPISQGIFQERWYVYTSFYDIRILGLGVLDVMLVSLVLSVLLRTISARAAIMDLDSRVSRLLARLWTTLVLLSVFGIVNGVFHAVSIKHLVSDLRTFAYLLGFSFVAWKTMRREDISLIFSGFIALSALKSMVYLYRLFTGTGVQHNLLLRTILGSDLAFLAVGALFAISVLSLLNLPRWKQALLFIVVCLNMVIIFNSAGRSNILLLAIALAILALINKCLGVLKFFLIAIAISLGFLYIYYGKGALDFLTFKLVSSFHWTLSIYKFGSYTTGTTTVRLIELLNIVETLKSEGKLLLGLGWGSGWSDIFFPLPPDPTFSIFSPLEGSVHLSAHTDVAWLLLKTGVIGVIVYYMGCAAVFREFLLISLRVTDNYHKAIVSSFTAALSMLMLGLYFDRITIIWAVFLGMGRAFSYLVTIEEVNPSHGSHGQSL